MSECATQALVRSTSPLDSDVGARHDAGAVPSAALLACVCLLIIGSM